MPKKLQKLSFPVSLSLLDLCWSQNSSFINIYSDSIDQQAGRPHLCIWMTIEQRGGREEERGKEGERELVGHISFHASLPTNQFNASTKTKVLSYCLHYRGKSKKIYPGGKSKGKIQQYRWNTVGPNSLCTVKQKTIFTTLFWFATFVLELF